MAQTRGTRASARVAAQATDPAPSAVDDTKTTTKKAPVKKAPPKKAAAAKAKTSKASQDADNASQDSAPPAADDSKPATTTKKAPAKKTAAANSKTLKDSQDANGNSQDPSAAPVDGDADAEDDTKASPAPASPDAAPVVTTSKPLKGCAIFVSGNFSSVGHNLTSIKKLIKDLGGLVPSSVTKSTTHIVCASSEVFRKVYDAVDKMVPLMQPEWVTESESQKRHLPEKDFLHAFTRDWTDPSTGKSIDLTQDDVLARSVVGSAHIDAANGTSAAPAAAATQTKKRGRATTDSAEVVKNENDEEAPAAKKSKLASRVAVKDEADDEAKLEPEVKTEENGDGDEDTVAEGQIALKKDLIIPVDEFFPAAGFQVHIDPDTGMIYDASLNQSNATANNNKFYRDQVVYNPSTKTYKAWTRWGRVGDVGQHAELGNGTLADAIKCFEKKFKDKSGLTWEKRLENPKPGKYAFVERSYNPDSDDEDDTKTDKKGKTADEEEEKPKIDDCTLEKPIKELVELIFNQTFFQNTMAAMNYDANKLPLGKLSKNTILRGFKQLKDLAALFDDPSLAQSEWNMSIAAATEHLSNTYYSVIPHDFGRARPPIIRDNTLLKKEVELLESLSDMKDAADLMKIDRKKVSTIHPLDRQFQGLGLKEMTTLDHKSNEFTLLEQYLNGTRGATHHVNYEVQDIWRIERPGENDRYEQSDVSKVKSDRRLLWHGSRCTNFGGILSQGLRIAPPEAPVNGYMFGKGVYLADMSSKSAGYCCSYNTNGQALLLLCDAELGQPMQELTGASYSAPETAKKNGQIATHGKGRTGPSKWVDAGDVHPTLKGVKMPDPKVAPGDTNVAGAGLYYNEYIAYDIAQVRLRYLFRVKM